MIRTYTFWNIARNKRSNKIFDKDNAALFTDNKIKLNNNLTERLSAAIVLFYPRIQQYS